MVRVQLLEATIVGCERGAAAAYSAATSIAVANGDVAQIVAGAGTAGMPARSLHHGLVPFARENPGW